ncbi:alpha-glucosidase mal12 [Neopestalotiopsis sp. 37M]|nr:alpha-glucosidase mal12 [Neopestalotiopsis sp. 37M]
MHSHNITPLAENADKIVPATLYPNNISSNKLTNGLCQKTEENGTQLLGKEPWWKAGVFYQVYPASFMDSNGDGWGDIPGLISKLDYLTDLGVDCVWLSPVFDSPQADMGYDVRDYQAIYAPYGTAEDVDRLTKECHRRGMKLILDLVVNHTSMEHAWFKESRSSKTNPKRDWYIWKPARYNSQGERIPPTNWRGYFACPTWTWDEETQEYYLHLYAPDQPDLNWENPECRDAIYTETMRFWLDRGVDGFRIDTVNKYSKRTEYQDAPVTDPRWESQPAPEMWCNGPRIHEFIHEMHEKALAPYQAVSVGELSNMSGPADVLPYVGASRRELDMVFEFSMIRLGTGGGFGPKYIYQPYTLPTLKRHVARFQTFIEGTDGWTTVFCENHDNGRAVSRFGDAATTELWRASARTLALWQATLTGTLFLYQGQEIGMVNMPADWPIDEYKDVESRNFYADALSSSSTGGGGDEGDEGDVDGDHQDCKRRADETMRGLRILARDHARIPFQWDGEAKNAGFSEADATWMRVHDGYRDINVERQAGDPGSVLEFWKRLLRIRKGSPDVFVHGAFRSLRDDDLSRYVYVKESRLDVQGGGGIKRRALVVMNWSSEALELGEDVKEVLGCTAGDVRLLVCTTDGCQEEETRDDSVLRPWEGRVYVNFKP